MRTTSMMLSAALLALGACSFEVTNPGPVQDAALDDPGAWAALVRGVQYNTSRAVSLNSFYSAVAAKEYSTAGRINATKLPLVFGQLTVDDMSGNSWTWSHAARWTAEDGVARLRRVLGDAFASNKFAGQLLMYAALTNRMLGECMCQAVIDGDSARPHTVHLTRAESFAAEAVDVAVAAGDAATANAARGVLASVQLYLGKFAEAAQAAQLVPTSFVLLAPFDQDAATRNFLVVSNDYANGGSFRSHTTWRTFFESYYRTTGDPRTWWDSLTSPATARYGEFTSILWNFQRKYVPTRTTADYASPIRLVSGREMRLVEAEVALRNNDIGTAMSLINGIRTAVNSRFTNQPLQPWVANNAQEAWDALRREREIELWLEARTMGDLRRWIDDGTYATFTNGPDSDVADRIRLCFPISRQERQNNPNLSLEPNDPVNPIFNNTVAPW